MIEKSWKKANSAYNFDMHKKYILGIDEVGRGPWA